MTKITSISLFLSLILFITCSPHKKPTNKDNSDRKEPFYRSKDTVINTSIPRKNTKEVLYADFLDKQLSTLCKHFKSQPTDTLFYGKEKHGNYFGGFETWDYPKICFVFGKDSIIEIDLAFMEDKKIHSNNIEKKHSPHLYRQDYAALLTFYCKGITLISNDSIQIAYRKVENPYNDAIDEKHIHDKHIRKYFPTRIPNEVLTLHKIHYEDFIQKPSLLFLEAIEKCYKIDKIKFKRNGSGPIYTMLLYVKNSPFHYTVRAKFANCSPSIQEILGDSLNTAQIPAFIEQHKDMLAEPIVYITIYANQKFRLTYENYNHEFEHYCLGSKLKKNR